MKNLTTLIAVITLITTNIFSQTHITTDTEWATDQVLLGSKDFPSTNNASDLINTKQMEGKESNQNRKIPHDRLLAINNRKTFVSNDRDVIDIQISVTADYYYTESSWNLWSYDDEAYYFANAQTFNSASENQTVVLQLNDGGTYSLDCYDSFNDGGISGDIFDNNLLASWQSTDYSTYGSFSFQVGEGDPLNVPSDYPTIQAGLDAAFGGSTVLVATGTYTENIIWPEFYGGIKLIGSSMDECIIDGNYISSVFRFEEDEFGAIDNTTLIEGFTIQTGSAYQGGGIYCSESTPTFKNLIIKGNTGQFGGGIACIMNSEVTLINVEISGNTGWYAGSEGGKGGGIYCYESWPELFKVTITNNSADVEGGGIYLYSNSTAFLDHCILQNNSPQDITTLYLSSVDATYSDIYALGTGNIDEDPLFVDPLNGDYHLTENSPCIDAGNPSQGQVDPDGTILDMGAYYYHQYPNSAPDSFELEYPTSNTEIVITNDNIGETLTFNWGISTDVDGDDVYYTLEGTEGLSFLNTDNLENNSIEWSYDELVSAIGDEPTVSGTWGIVASDGVLSTEATNGPFNLSIDISATLSVEENLIPEVFALHQSFPNPFNPITTLPYDLPENSFVNITIYDMLGREVKHLVNENQDAGYKSVIWDATNNLGQTVSAGMYLYQINAGNFHSVKKMVLLK